MSDSGEQQTPPSRLFTVWPTDLRKEWRARTWYGKLWFTMLFPWYVFGWVFILAFAVLFGVGFYALKGLYRLALLVDRGLPNTYKEETDG